MDNFHLFQIPTDLELFNWNDKSPEVSRGGVAGEQGHQGAAGESRGHGQSYQGEPAGALTLRQASQGDPAEH